MPRRPLGPVRCPACGQMALPLQTRCLNCNARLNEVVPVETAASDAVHAAPPVPPPITYTVCPGCGKELSVGAVLCIECGYDLRTGRKRDTVHALAEEQPGRCHESLPVGLGKVRLGLGFHYARLVLTLAAILVMMGLTCYEAMARPEADDPVQILGGLAAVGVALLAVGLGIVGSTLCLWVGRASGARAFIFVSLLLDVLILPLFVYLQIAALSVLIGWVIAFASWVLFMVFLRRLAVYIDRPGEANELMVLITRGVALLVAVPLLLVLLAQFAFLYAHFSKDTARLILMASTLIFVVQFVFLLKLFFSILGNIRTLRAAIASRLPGDDQEEEENSRVVLSAE